MLVRRGVIALLIGAACVARSGAQTSESAARRGSDALVRPGDRIMLRVLRENDLNADLIVSEQGEAPFPKLGVLTVATMSIAKLQDTLRTRYAEFLRFPAVDVVVLRRIVVQGAVRNPSVYMVDVATTVRDIIAQAGGVSESGDPRKVKILRDGKEIKVKGWEAESGPIGDLTSGDQVYVSRKSWIALNLLSTISTSVVVISLLISASR